MSRRGGGGGCQFGTTKKGKRVDAEDNATLSSKRGEGDNFFFAFPIKNLVAPNMVFQFLAILK